MQHLVFAVSDEREGGVFVLECLMEQAAVDGGVSVGNVKRLG